MIPLLAVMLAGYIVARCCDTLAERSPNDFTRGLAVFAAVVAAGIAVICALLIVQEGQTAAEAVRELLP